MQNKKLAEEKAKEVTAENAEALVTQYKKLDGPKITGKKIDLKQFDKTEKEKARNKACKRQRSSKETKAY